MSFLSGRLRNIFQSEKSLFIVFSSIAIFLFFYNIIHDLIESKIMGLGYYFSESLLFSIIWIIFIPVSFIVYSNKLFKASKLTLIVTLISTIIVHIIVYALFVWVLSIIFMDNVFHPTGVFKYGALEYFLILILLYLAYFLLLHNISPMPSGNNEKISYNSKLIVNINGMNYLLDIAEVLYFQAQTPYISVVTSQRKYLIQKTLKEMSQCLDPDVFIRIHKSAIINIHQIKSYTSRQNGDYDLLMNNGDSLRMSRNFLNDFKTKMKI